MAEALFACPHCAGRAEARRFTGGAAYVICTECGIQTPYLKPDEAVRRWNMRPNLKKRERERVD